MPGLSVIDGTPRNCVLRSCGALGDSPVMKDEDIELLGRTQKGGPVHASTNIEIFMNSLPSRRRGMNRRRQTGIESGVKGTAGQGKVSGLPTSDDNGLVHFTYRQVNQDGAGTFIADIDSTSGGTDESARQPAFLRKNVPGLAGISLATNTNFEASLQVPAGTVCTGTVASVKNVCVFRIRNNTPAGPFGGSGAFTQSPAARKRVIAERDKAMKSGN